MENHEKEVYFDQYCKACKYEELDENEFPCCECLYEPVNENSHKPVKWEKKTKE